MTVSIRRSEELRKRLAAFHAEGKRRLAKMKKTRSGVPAAEVFKYLESRAEGGCLPRPKPRRMA